jgi:DEAD/DEAH box helicase domain-containing protein
MPEITLSPLARLLHTWEHDPQVAPEIVTWRRVAAHPGARQPLAEGLHPALQAALQRLGYHDLYTHQAQAYQHALQGRNFVVATGTASGKSLCYHLPVLDALLKDPAGRALYLFPTKALAQDQLKSLHGFSAALLAVSNSAIPNVAPAIYDGDTPTSQRTAIRQKARLLISNPDMLHIGILPHHTLWAEFFRNLRFVVIDEIHVYRGVFGSHLANLLRRLRRVVRFYGGSPLFILTSATISNPGEFARRLIEAEVELVSEDGAPQGERNLILYNPPIVQPETGLRRSASSESLRLTSDLLDYGVQTILFARARRTVEIMLRNLRFHSAGHADNVHAYRSGYLPAERREIERKLRQGEARAVIATNALELGIDIGSLDAAILVGFPGSIAATRQQFGRAGRKTGTSLGVLVASGSPIDQYLMKHPEYIFDRSPEQALIDPDNLVILIQHLRCAAFELPFNKDDWFGNLPLALLQSLLAFLEQSGVVHFSGTRYFWMAGDYPANSISLRSSDDHPILLQALDESGWTTAGVVDHSSAAWMVHPGAVYLHAGQAYLVESLDLEKNVARMQATEVDYFTDPQKQVTLEKISELESRPLAGGSVCYGEILVTSQVTGFKRIRWYTNEMLGLEPLDLPPSQLRTTAAWLVVGESTLTALRDQGLWRNDPNHYGPNWDAQRKNARRRDHFTCQVCGAVENGQTFHVHHKTPFRAFASYAEANQLENLIPLCPSCHIQVEQNVRIRSGLAGLTYVLHNLATLFVMCDQGDLGASADPQSSLAEGQPVVVLYDEVPAGIGLSQKIYELIDNLLSAALEHVQTCECQDGCPACVGPGGENGSGGKQETLALLAALAGRALQGLPHG